MALALTYSIIAGSNKCGTTSLFRYLADHPDVRPTRVKELSFWHPQPQGSPEQLRARYESRFIPAKRDAPVRLEGTPHYLYSSEFTAAIIHRNLPAARLIFLLRDPAQRLASFFKAAYGQPHHIHYELRFEELVDIAIRHYHGERGDRRGESLAYELKVGQYAKHLKVYERVWPREQMHVMFFEDMARDPRGQLRAVARYLGVDEDFYDTYPFAIEHKSRRHRWPLLRLIGSRVNHMLEPVLTNNVRVKRALHRIYFSINEDNRPIVIEPGALERAKEFYREANAELADWMSAVYPQQALPAWLANRSRVMDARSAHVPNPA